MNRSEIHRISLQKLKALILEDLIKEVNWKVPKDGEFELARTIVIETSASTIEIRKITHQGALKYILSDEVIPFEEFDEHELIALLDVLEDS